MASGESKRISRDDIQKVQNLIERCLQLYMTHKEVVDILRDQAAIEPSFTELVWEKLQEENQEFFEAYRLRMVVKNQIEKFNELLERQNGLMHHIYPSEFAPIANGSQIPLMQPSGVLHSLEHVESSLKMETADQDFNRNLHNAYIGVSPLQACAPSMDLTIHAGRIERPSNMPLSQNTNVRMIGGMDGEMLKAVDPYTGNTAVAFGGAGNALDAHPTVGGGPISSYNSVVPNPQPLNRSYLDRELPAAGFLSQIPRNFSLSDLTADFNATADILENYSGSMFVGSHHDNFLDPQERGPVAPS